MMIRFVNRDGYQKKTVMTMYYFRKRSNIFNNNGSEISEILQEECHRKEISLKIKKDVFVM
jgi:hypothetical protein